MMNEAIKKLTSTLVLRVEKLRKCAASFRRVEVIRDESRVHELISLFD